MSLASGGAELPAVPEELIPEPCPPSTIQSDGLASVQTCHPPQIQSAIEAGNRIRKKPYRYGGGHGSFQDKGYDCSGSVSYVLHGAGLLQRPLSSGPLSVWGRRGKGRWITVYANASHAYMEVAGLRFDTSGTNGKGPRWQLPKPNVGYRARHPSGL